VVSAPAVNPLAHNAPVEKFPFPEAVSLPNAKLQTGVSVGVIVIVGVLVPVIVIVTVRVIDGVSIVCVTVDVAVMTKGVFVTVIVAVFVFCCAGAGELTELLFVHAPIKDTANNVRITAFSFIFFPLMQKVIPAIYTCRYQPLNLYIFTFVFSP
jgi:hypothetical protein